MTIEVKPNSRGPVILLSGGLDSAVALAMLRSQGVTDIIGVTFDYRQLNKVNELAAARHIAHLYGVEHRVIGLGGIFLNSALTGHIEDIPETPAINGPDATFVPGRNAVLISIGVAIAQGSGSSEVVTGCNFDDAAGYPDTTFAFMEYFNDAMNIGYGIRITNPLLTATKADIVRVARELSVPIDKTWSCYRDGETQCGRCGSCSLNGVSAL